MAQLTGMGWDFPASVGLSSIIGTITIGMAGQSNNAGDASQTDSTYGSAALAGYVTCRQRGTDLANWLANPGFAPWLAAEVNSQGASAVRIVDRSVSGSPISATRTTYLQQLFDDLDALSWGQMDFFHFWQGEYECHNTTGSEAASLGWEDEFMRIAVRVRKHSPNCRILVQELVTDDSQYPHRATLRASQAAAVARIGNAVLLPETTIATEIDNVHAAPDNANGYPLAASRCGSNLTV